MKNQFRRMTAGILAMLMVISSPVSSLAEVKAASPSEATTEYSSPSNASYQDEEAVVGDAGNINTEVEEVERSDEAKTASPSEAEEIAFNQSQMVDGIVITVTADKGVFPKGAKLKVTKVTNKKELKDIETAIEEEREEDKNVASSNTFDIQILDNAGKETQPDNSKGTVSVKFSVAEKLNDVLDVAVYHVEDKEKSIEVNAEGVIDDGEITDDVTESAEDPEHSYKAEALETVIKEKKQTTEVEVKTEGFSIYVVEFTYGELQYVLQGDSSIKLSEILDTLGLTGEVTEAEVSDEELFVVTEDKDKKDWTVTAKKAFDSEEWLKITIGGQTFDIIVTDEQEESEEDQIEIEIGKTYQYTVSITSGEYKKAPIVTIESTGRPIFSLTEKDMTQFIYQSGFLVGGKCMTTVTITGLTPGTSTVFLKYNSKIVDERTIIVKSSSASISYELNGGKNDPSNPTEYDGTDIKILRNAKKTGYTFAGWYKEESFKNKITQIEKTDNPQDITLYAKWTPIAYTVKFDGNGSTSGSMSAQSRKYDDGVALTSNAFKKTGYTFTGWNINKDGSGKSYANKDTSNIRSTAEPITLYAQWKKNTYTITYELNGGKNSSSNPATYTITSATITLVNPTRTGYTFAGWYSDSKLTKKATTTIKKGSTGNKTFYAKWTANTYKIAFNANGGTGTAPKTISTSYGKTVTLPANPFKKTNYTFTGWNTKKDGSGTNYANTASVKNVTSTNGKTVTLYAQWRKSIHIR